MSEGEHPLFDRLRLSDEEKLWAMAVSADVVGLVVKMSNERPKEICGTPIRLIISLYGVADALQFMERSGKFADAETS